MMDEIDMQQLRGLAGHTAELGLRYVAHGEDWAEMAF
ncbi:MAG: phenylacetic acid degradation protein, partial [Sphingomonas sp.]|nr:phenylacetic acid degradation protein [Sphingomonas sp.]